MRSGASRVLTVKDRLKRYDLHVYTVYSEDSSIKIKDALRRAEELKLMGIAVTDHNTVEGALRAVDISQNYQVEVILGIEVSSTAGDILGINVKQLIESSEPRVAINEIHEQGASS